MVLESLYFSWSYHTLFWMISIVIRRTEEASIYAAWCEGRVPGILAGFTYRTVLMPVELFLLIMEDGHYSSSVINSFVMVKYVTVGYKKIEVSTFHKMVWLLIYTTDWEMCWASSYFNDELVVQKTARSRSGSCDFYLFSVTCLSYCMRFDSVYHQNYGTLFSLFCDMRDSYANAVKYFCKIVNVKIRGIYYRNVK